MAPWHFPYSLLLPVEHKVSDNVCTAKYSKQNIKKFEDKYGDFGHALEVGTLSLTALARRATWREALRTAWWLVVRGTCSVEGDVKARVKLRALCHEGNVL